jgi:hypothetical protein
MGYIIVAFNLTMHKNGSVFAILVKSLSSGRAALWTGRRKEQPLYPVLRN